MLETDISPDLTHQRQIEKLHFAIEQADSVTVEIGTGNYPLFERGGQRQFDQNNLYIGINIDSRQHLPLADKVDTVSGFAILNSRESQQPLTEFIPERSIDTLFMGNVLGEPDSDMIMWDFKHADGEYKGNSDFEAKLRTLKEASKLLKNNGRLILFETITPFNPGAFVDAKYGRFADGAVEVLSEVGYIVEEVVCSKDKDWKEAVSQFSSEGTVDMSWYSYIIVAKHRNFSEN